MRNFINDFKWQYCKEFSTLMMPEENTTLNPEVLLFKTSDDKDLVKIFSPKRKFYYKKLHQNCISRAEVLPAMKINIKKNLYHGISM